MNDLVDKHSTLLVSKTKFLNSFKQIELSSNQKVMDKISYKNFGSDRRSSITIAIKLEGKRNYNTFRTFLEYRYKR